MPEINFPFSIFHFPLLKKGYTLIEFLIVIGILAIVVGSTLLFLTAILKGTNQASIVSEVKQNGQAVLGSLDKQVRNAKDVVCVNSTNVVSCLDPSASNKYIQLINASGPPLHIKCFNDNDIVKIQNGWIGSALSATIPSDGSYVSITNQDTTAGVDIVNCNFKVSPGTVGASEPAVVSISFGLHQGVSAPSRTDFKANAQFQTTISLRKY